MKLVSYIRVSTEQQNQSGLGLTAQKFSIEHYAKSVGAEIVAHFEEIVSGGMKDRISANNHLTVEKLLAKRPVLQEALQYCQKNKATLVVKEASRLTRYSLLMDFLLASKIDFVCADSPNDSPLIIRIKTALHEEELLKISERTKAALAAKKAQGWKAGSPVKPTKESLQKATEQRISIAANSKENRQATHTILGLKKDGKTFREIVDALNGLGFTTSTGKPFSVSSVHMLYKRHQEQQKKALEKKRFDAYWEAKMESESSFTPASYKEQPDLSPDKIQLELEDGVAYISKKSGWVLSQF